jgi:hypothetical protein
VDWEEWRSGFDPLYDLAHYVVRSGALLDSFSPEQAASLLTERNSPGWQHLEDIGVEPRTAPQLVADYVRRWASAPAPVGPFQKRLLNYLP